MDKGYIYLKINGSMGDFRLILKDDLGIVFDEVCNGYDAVKVPILDKRSYLLLICSSLGILGVPLYAIKDRVYCISVDNRNVVKRNRNILLMDYNYPEIKIKEGEIILWQSIM